MIDLCLQGDAIAQRALVETYGPYLLTTCRRYAPPSWEAEDILQEAFIKIFYNLDRIDFSKGAPRAYMNRICINVALSKKLKFKRTADLEELKWSKEETTQIEPEVYGKLGAEEIMEMVAKLPRTYADVFNLYVIEGFSHREIAEKLNISENTVKTHKKIAYAKLKKKINIMNTLTYTHQYLDNAMHLNMQWTETTTSH